MRPLYESYAIFGEFTKNGLDTEEMKEGLPNRIFNETEALHGNDIELKKKSNGEIIRLKPGVYRISGVSFLTMLQAGTPPVPPVPVQYLSDVYPGYCILYDAENPPTETGNMSGIICVGTMGTAYDSGPSIFDCVLEVKKKPMEISLGHQCTYDNPKGLRPKVYLRIGGTDNHVCARISIFKIA